MSIIDAINQNTSAVTNGKMRLKAAINNNGGSVSQAGTVPTFQELIDGLTGVTGGGVNTAVSGDTMTVTALSNISKGSVVKVMTNNAVAVSYDLSNMLPIYATVDGITLTMYKIGYSYRYASCYTPVLSKSAQMMVGFYRSSTDTDVLYAVPFFKVNGTWKQMMVNGKYTAAHRRSSIEEHESQSYMFCYDDSSGAKLAVIGDTIYSVDETNLNIISKHTISLPTSYTYITKTFIYGSLVVVVYYWYASSTSSRGTYTTIYNYDAKTQQATLLDKYFSRTVEDITTNGKDVFIMLHDFYVYKYSLGTDGVYSKVGSLKITNMNSDIGWQHGFLARGCTAAVACDAGNIEYSLRYYEIDPETFTITNGDVDVIFPSENVIIERTTRDFNYFLVQYGSVTNHSQMYIWEREVDDSTGKIKYVNKYTLESKLNGVTDTYGLYLETPQFLFESLNHILISIGSSDDHKQNREITLADGSDFYTAIGSNFLSSYEDVVATGYALDDIPAGSSGRIKITSYVYGAEQEIKQSSAYANAQLDDINGETV